jgi:hypothetical protein
MESNIQKDKYGFYKEDTLRKMELKDIIKLMIKETCYQDTLNIIRIVAKEHQVKKQNKETE